MGDPKERCAEEGAGIERSTRAATERLVAPVMFIDPPRRRLVPSDSQWRPEALDEATPWVISWYGIPAKRPGARARASVAARLSFTAHSCMRSWPLPHSLIDMVESSTCCNQDFVISLDGGGDINLLRVRPALLQISGEFVKPHNRLLQRLRLDSSTGIHDFTDHQRDNRLELRWALPVSRQRVLFVILGAGQLRQWKKAACACPHIGTRVATALWVWAMGSRIGASLQRAARLGLHSWRPGRATPLVPSERQVHPLHRPRRITRRHQTSLRLAVTRSDPLDP